MEWVLRLEVCIVMCWPGCCKKIFFQLTHVSSGENYKVFKIHLYAVFKLSEYCATLLRTRSACRPCSYQTTSCLRIILNVRPPTCYLISL